MAKKKVSVPMEEIEIPEKPPTGFGHTEPFASLPEEQQKYLQDCWDKLSDGEKAAVVKDTRKFQ